MHLPTILAALALPLAAIAEDLTTVTSTSKLTLTKTITLQRAEVTGASNSTSSITSASTTTTLPASTTSSQAAASTTADKNAAPALGAANLGVVAVAGVVAAVLL